MAKNKRNIAPKVEAVTGPGFSVPAILLAVITAVWAFFVVKSYYAVYPFSIAIIHPYFFSKYQQAFSLSVFLPVFFSNFLSLLAAMLIFLAANGLGKPVVRTLGMSSEDYLEDCVINTAAGLFLLMIFFTAVGMAGFFYPAAVISVLAAGLGYNIYVSMKPDAVRAALWEEIKMTPIHWKLILALSAMIGVLGSLAPETFYDSLSYHLTIPHFWNLNHTVKALWCHHQSYIVAYLHIFYAIGLMLGGEISAKFVNLGFAALSFAAVYSFCRKHLNLQPQAGVLSLLIFITVPLSLIVSTHTGMEFPLTFIEFFAAYAVIKSLSTENNAQLAFRWLITAGLFLGISGASKYTSAGAVIGVASGLIYYYSFKRRDIKKGLTSILLICSVTLAVMSPWLIRNYIETGHPLYPFIFNDQYTGFKVLIHGKQLPANDMAPLKPTIRVLLGLPWDLTMGKVGQEGYAGAALLLLAPLVLFMKRIDWKIKYLMFYAAAYYLFWMAGRPYLRYFIPALAVISVILGYCVSALDTAFRKAVAVVLFAVFVSNILFAMSIQKNMQDPVGVALGMESKRDYLSTQRPSYVSPYYGAAAWMNENIPKDAQVMVFCDPRGLYINRNFSANFMGDANPLIEFIKETKTAAGAYEKMKTAGYAYILVNSNEIKRVSSYGSLYWDAQDLTVFNEFWKQHVRLAYFDIADISIPGQGIFSMKVQQSAWWERYAADFRSYVYVYEIAGEEAAKAKPVPLNLFLLKDYYNDEQWNSIKNTAEKLQKG